MYYSTPKTGRGPPGESPGSMMDPRSLDWHRTDWTCMKCGYHNFKRRDHCFKCSISREESDRAKEGDGFDQVGNNQCNTLIFRGLDALTTEENISTALGKRTPVAVKNVTVVRDELTGTSRGFGFAEFGSLAESAEVLQLLQDSQAPFDVDGKAIVVCYAKNTFSTIKATMSQQAQWAAQGGTGYDYTQYDQSSYYSQNGGQYYDPQTGQYYDYAAYYAQQQQQAAAATTATAGVPQTQTDSTNAAAAVAQAAMQQAAAAKQYQKQQQEMQQKIMDQLSQQQKLEAMAPEERLAHQAAEWSHGTEKGATEYTTYPTPDVSTYQYDETSGYYYDPTTGLYYDANTQYYYNSTTGQFMYWDGEKSTYLPAPNQEQLSKAAPNMSTDMKPDDRKLEPEGEKDKKKEDRREKVKVAKKIAKDMEKWAKTLNAQKEAIKEGFKRNLSSLGQMKVDRESAAADAGFAILEKASKPDRLDFITREDKQLMPPPPMPGGAPPPPPGSKPGLVASYGGDSEEEEEEDPGEAGNEEEKLTDWSKLACLLCKRQFPTKEALNRHQELSDLHKTNLEELRKSKGMDAGGQYRDRAKERRDKFGKPAPPMPRKRKDMNAGVPPSLC